MKISFNPLSAQLPLANCYLVSGDDVLQKEQIHALIQKRAQEKNYTQRELHIVDTSFNWQSWLESLQQNDLFFDAARLIELVFVNPKLDRNAQEYLLKAVAQLQETLLLISTPKLDATVQRTAWYKWIENNGVVITIYPVKATIMANWIPVLFQQQNLKINREDANWLSQQIGHDTLILKQLMTWLSLTQTAEPISKTLLQEWLFECGQFQIFDLIDALIAGNITQTLHIITRLKQIEYEPMLTLWGIARTIREWIALKSGETPFSIKPAQLKAVQQAAARLSISELERSLQHIARIDWEFKQAKLGVESFWCLIENIGLFLCSKKALVEVR